MLCADRLLSSHSRAHEDKTSYHYPLAQQAPFWEAFPHGVTTPAQLGTTCLCPSALTAKPTLQVRGSLGSFLTAVSIVSKAVLAHCSCSVNTG